MRATERRQRVAHARFLEQGAPTTAVRTIVAESWLRSSAAGVDPDVQLAPVVFEGGDLAEYRAAHPLSQVFPLLYDVLGRVALDCESLMAVGDADGRLLWVCGATGVLRQAESIHFVEGAAWGEHEAGTNAPGTALHLDAAVQIASAEHFTRPVQRWSCSAAPIHDPHTHEILGLVDMSGGPDVATPQTLGLVRAAARMAESELARLAMSRGLAAGGGEFWSPRPDGYATEAALRVRALGLPDCIVEAGGRPHRLSPRHSEILVALVDNPDGLTAERLELEIHETRVHSSTMRAEMTRLRGLLGPGVLESRPYRLGVDTDCDWVGVGAHVAAGRVREAIRAYRGPLLPQSRAPGIAERRDRLQRQLRAAVLASGEADLMAAWTRSHWGADDLEMWQAQAGALPAGSPLRPIAAAETARLERELGLP